MTLSLNTSFQAFALINVQALAMQTMQAMQAMQEILLLSVIGISETLSGSSPWEKTVDQAVFNISMDTLQNTNQGGKPLWLGYGT